MHLRVIVKHIRLQVVGPLEGLFALKSDNSTNAFCKISSAQKYKQEDCLTSHDLIFFSLSQLTAIKTTKEQSKLYNLRNK